MKKRSLNKTQLTSWVTILVIVFLAACYFFIYIPANESRVEQQRFRSLQNMQRNLQTKIDNSVALMDLLLTAYYDSPANVKMLDEYIKNYATDKFKLTIPKIRYIIRDSTDSIRKYRVDVNKAAETINITSCKVFEGSSTKSSVYSMSLQYSIPQFITPLLPGDVFDEYLVFSNDKLIYETLPAGITKVNSDSLLVVKNGIWGTTVRSFSISGTNYKLFLQPVNIGDKECAIGGLLSNSRYMQERAQLPAGMVMFLITLVLIIILSTPWIKLSQMGNQDRLTISDAIITVLISMLLMSLLFFMFFKYNVPLRADFSKNQRAALAKNISNAFEQEVEHAYAKLTGIDTLVKDASEDIVNLATDSLMFANVKTVSEGKYIDSLIGNFPLKQVFWLNENGYEVINWNTGNLNGPHGNYDSRPYFLNIINESHYLLHDDVLKPYFIDQLVSRTTGKFTTVLSMPSVYKGKDSVPVKHVVAMSFQVTSLANVLLPQGFQYAIVDQHSKVLYHSDSTRSLNENLLEEFSDNEDLKSLLIAKSSGTFMSPYYSGNYLVYAQPLNNLPYFMVVMEDLSFKETRDMEAFSFTIFGMLCFLGFMLLQMLVTFLVSSRRSSFKRHFYNTSWIAPKRSSHRQYNLSSAANLFLIILLLVFERFSSFLSYCYILLFSVTVLSLFLNGIFARKYQLEKHSNYQFKINAIWWLAFCTLILNFTACLVLTGVGLLTFLSFELIAVLGFFPLYFYGNKYLNKARASIDIGRRLGWNFASSFTLLALTRLIISSGIPVMFFYTTAFNYEQNLSLRYKQVTFAKSLIARVKPSELTQAVNNINKSTGVYVDGYSINEADIVSYKDVKQLTLGYSREDSITLQLLNVARIKITDNAIDDDKLYWQNSVDTAFIHSNILRANSRNGGAVTCVETHIPGFYLRLKSLDLDYGFSHLLKSVLFYFLLITVLVLFYLTLRNMLVKLFALSIPDFAKWQLFDDQLLVTTGLNNLLFAIGLPGSGKLTRVLTQVQNGKLRFSDSSPYVYNKEGGENDVFVVELMNIPDAHDSKEDMTAWTVYKREIFAEKNRLLIFNHFEYNIQDAQTSRIKLNLLEKVMLQNRARVIILSTIHPVAFLDSVYSQAGAETNNVPGQDLERWHVLLGHFRIVILPLQKERLYAPANKVEQIVFEETEKTHFLAKMRSLALEVGTTMNRNKRYTSAADELAIKLQMSSHYFYMYVWQSLTKEEKLLLYDLAEDNLVNSVDDYNLNMLICKGVIVRSDGSLRLFNNGFRNFILTAIGNIELMKIKNLIHDNGNWNKVKYPLYIIFVAIVLFLFSSQKEAYTKLLTYAAALGTAIPAILKIFSLFDGTKQKPS